MFKVVTDQLKVSQGWVRCGHCSEVFDASLHLQPAVLPDHAAPLLPQAFSASSVYAPYSEPERQPVQAPTPAGIPGICFVDSQGLPVSESQASMLDGNHVVDFDPVAWTGEQTATLVDESGTLQLDEYGKAVRAHALDAQGLMPDPPATREDSEDIQSEFPLEAPTTAENVSFVRDAQRQIMWRKPGVRLILGLVAVALVVVMLLQVLVQQRDSVAALEPRFKPWLQILCSVPQCEVTPLRRIESVVIDSSTFNKMDADFYRLNFSLKNFGTAQVAMPSLEVTLTDSGDQALVRRVLSPSQLGLVAAALGAGIEVAGAVTMQVGDISLATTPTTANMTNTSGITSVSASNSSLLSGPLRVAGYRVLAFYP